MILADTKFEFGKCMETGKIILMDELFTCDSSRFWDASTYENQLNNGKAPHNFDKDVIRNYVKGTGCDPYKEKMPIIPSSLIEQTQNIYLNFFNRLTGEHIKKIDDNDNINVKEINNHYNLKNSMSDINHFTNTVNILEDIIQTNRYDIFKNIVIIYSGSTSDKWHITKIQKALAEKGIYSEDYYISAHKNPAKLLEKLNEFETIAHYKNLKIINAAVAGMSSALGAVIAANNKFATISCPPYKDQVDMLTNVQSTLQNPSNVPVAVILSPGNLAHFCSNVFKTIL